MPLAIGKMRLLARDGKLLTGDPDECECCAPCTADGDTPTKWRLRDSYYLYASGDVIDLALVGLPNPWVPEAYYGLVHDMRLEVKCNGEWIVKFPVDAWTETIVLCAGDGARYPSHTFEPTRNPCCTLDILTIGDPPDPPTPVAPTVFFPDSDAEWSNLANWRGSGGAKATRLPNASDSVYVSGADLTSCSLSATPTVANLTTPTSTPFGFFGISINVTGALYLNSRLLPSKCGGPLTITGNVIAGYAGGSTTVATIVGDYTRTGNGQNIVPPAFFPSLQNLTVTGVTTLNNIRIDATHPNASFGVVYVNNSSLYDGRNISGPITFSGTSEFHGDTISLRLNASADFLDYALNVGRISGAVTMSGNSQNMGLAEGSASFSDSSGNHPLGVVGGDATFSGTSANSGSVGGNAVFSDGATNYGTVSGTAALDGSATNRGTIAQHASFSGYSVNYSAVGGGASFSGASANRGIVTGTTTFYGSSSNHGTIIGDATFNDSSSNYGTVTGTKTCNTTGVC